MTGNTAIDRLFGREKRLAAALALGFALLFVAAGSAMVLSNRAMVAENWARQSLELRRLILAVKSAEHAKAICERGYLITQEPHYLADYVRATAKVRRLDGQLHSVAQDNPAQQQRADRLDRAIQATDSELDQTLSTFKAGAHAQALQSIRAHADESFARLETAAAAFDEAEARTLAERERQATMERRRLVAAIVVSLIASAALALFVLATLRRSLAELRRQNTELADEIERREASEAQLRQAQKMEALGHLTGGIAHDFNNMLGIVIGNLDMLSRRLPEDLSKLKAYVENAQEGAGRAAALTRSLLAYSRQQPLDPKSFDVNRAVADVSQLLKSTLGETIILETALAPDQWPAFIDGPQLESAIVNLAVNARDAMPGGGKLTLKTANVEIDEAYARERGVTPGQYVLVAMTDTGIGMAPEVAARAFDPFFTTKAPGAGTGLGLSQVEGFVRQSGGHVLLYSEPGVGTTVKLNLPRAQASAAERAQGLGGGELEQTRSALILVAEDEAAVRSFVRHALRELGHRVIEADGTAPALEKLRTRPEIELMLTDVIMPDGTGRDLADAARKIRPDLPIVFMTGYTRDAIVHNGVLDPDADLISKPFTLGQLAAKIARALAKIPRPDDATASNQT